jgi:hypothetical protein
VGVRGVDILGRVIVIELGNNVIRRANVNVYILSTDMGQKEWCCFYLGSILVAVECFIYSSKLTDELIAYVRSANREDVFLE